MVEPEEVPVFHEAVTRRTTVRVVLEPPHRRHGRRGPRRPAATSPATTGARSRSPRCPDERLHVIRAIEQAGGAIEEFHTDAPDWEALIQEHLGEMERTR